MFLCSNGPHTSLNSRQKGYRESDFLQYFDVSLGNKTHCLSNDCLQ